MFLFKNKVQEYMGKHIHSWNCLRLIQDNCAYKLAERHSPSSLVTDTNMDNADDIIPFAKKE